MIFIAGKENQPVFIISSFALLADVFKDSNNIKSFAMCHFREIHKVSPHIYHNRCTNSLSVPNRKGELVQAARGPPEIGRMEVEQVLPRDSFDGVRIGDSSVNAVLPINELWHLAASNASGLQTG
jgi:hypothetical protein